MKKTDWETWVDFIKDQTKDEPLVREIALALIGDGTAGWGALADKTDINNEGWLEAGRRDCPQATDSDIERANNLAAEALRVDGYVAGGKSREEALKDMRDAAHTLVKLIDIERSDPSGGLSWHAVEVALLDIRDAWEGAKNCEIYEAMGES